MFSCHVIGLQIKEVADKEHNGLDYVGEERSELRAVQKKKKKTEEGEEEKGLRPLTESCMKTRQLKTRTPLFDFVAVLPVQLSVTLWCSEKSLFYSSLVSVSFQGEGWWIGGRTVGGLGVKGRRSVMWSPCLMMWESVYEWSVVKDRGSENRGIKWLSTAMQSSMSVPAQALNLNITGTRSRTILSCSFILCSTQLEFRKWPRTSVQCLADIYFFLKNHVTKWLIPPLFL